MTQHCRALSPLRKAGAALRQPLSGAAAARVGQPAAAKSPTCASRPLVPTRAAGSKTAHLPKQAKTRAVQKPDAAPVSRNGSAVSDNVDQSVIAHQLSAEQQAVKEEFKKKRLKVLGEATEFFHELLQLQHAFIEPLPMMFRKVCSTEERPPDKSAPVKPVATSEKVPTNQLPQADTPMDKQSTRGVTAVKKEPAKNSGAMIIGTDPNSDDSDSDADGPTCIIADSVETVKQAPKPREKKLPAARQVEKPPSDAMTTDNDPMSVDQASLYFNRTVNAICVAGLRAVLDKKSASALDESHAYVRELDAAWRGYSCVDGGRHATAALANMVVELVDSVEKLVAPSEDGSELVWVGDLADPTVPKRFAVLLVVLSRFWRQLLAAMDTVNHAARHELQKALGDLDETVQDLHTFFGQSSQSGRSTTKQTVAAALSIAREKMKSD